MAADKSKRDNQPLRLEIRQRLAGYIIAALGLVASLAWNDAIKALIDYFYPTKPNSLVAKLLYAGVLTLIVALISTVLVRLYRTPSKK